VSPKAKPRCARCGGTDRVGPGPVRTSAHPNSSLVLVETPGVHYHDTNLEGTVCLDCGAVEVSVSAATLASLREATARRRAR